MAYTGASSAQHSLQVVFLVEISFLKGRFMNYYRLRSITVNEANLSRPQQHTFG